MHGVRVVFRRSLTQWDAVRKCKCLSTSARCFSAEAIPVPDPDSTPKSYAPKIQNIVNEISSLTLLEVSELSQLLKKRLHLPDAPAMPVGGFVPMGAAAAAAPAEQEEKTEAVKNAFTVKLVSFKASQKIPVIKEIKTLMDGMNLVQAKKFVESVPVVLRENVDKEEAEKIRDQLFKIGATAELE